MNDFIASNPGLESRFRRRIQFPNYSTDELLEILMNMTAAAGYTLSERSAQTVARIFETAQRAQGEKFGNARFARNILERAIEKQAVRVMAQEQKSTGDLQGLLPSDFEP